MAQNQKQNWEDMTLKSLEGQLRHLPEVEVPETLEAKLLTGIPERELKVRQEHQVRWWPGALGFGAVAAAVLILALIFIPSYAPSTPSLRPVIEPNDKSRDGLTDQNSAYVENTEPCGLQLLPVSQNEPGYRN